MHQLCWGSQHGPVPTSITRSHGHSPRAGPAPTCPPRVLVHCSNPPHCLVLLKHAQLWDGAQCLMRWGCPTGAPGGPHGRAGPQGCGMHDTWCKKIHRLLSIPLGDNLSISPMQRQVHGARSCGSPALQPCVMAHSSGARVKRAASPRQPSTSRVLLSGALSLLPRLSRVL